ncbi:hypothetical protein GL218_07674 [Daldinia childiae]|uniref:uncharacterized protein n=1 Tax=Daldinia childiae TaxID=326645 RepID=UPI0014453BD9|nr:uncharacterized protein GL218_07674 [Daldinia childiae]KAF3055242.1 hypothetical protein GL218_07674 [Daldinia childiae]
MLAASDHHQVETATVVEDSLRRRRERGRRSQANFRKRQAEANQHIRNQNQRLKDAIEKLVNLTRGDEHPELLNTIFDVAEAAGIDAKKPTHIAVQPISKHVTRNKQTLMSTADGEEDIVVKGTSRDIIQRSSRKENSGSSFTSSLASLPSPQRLTCGIWLDHQHYMRVSIPPDDIIPYLGPGSKTFAGILFWSIMDHARKQCTRSHTETTTSLIQRALDHSTATENWTITYIYAMVEARQEYRRTGSISAQYASAAERDLPNLMRNRIDADYHARGIDPNQWLSAMGIEGRVKNMIGKDSFAILETAAKGEGSLSLQDSLEDMKCKLAENCVCFGDGPRWNVDVVDALFLDWIYKTSRLSRN